MRRRFGGFHRHPPPRSPVIVANKTQVKRQRCCGCGSYIEPGEQIVRIAVRKAFRAGSLCACGRKMRKSKRYHLACAPADPITALGLDPTVVNPPPPSSNGGAVPPPPKPESVEDATLAALAALEHAVMIRAQRKGVTPEMREQFKTFQGIKARILRPGTPSEGDVATFVGLQRIIKLVF